MCNRPGLVREFPVKRCPPLAGFCRSYIDGLLQRVRIVKREKGMHLSKDAADRFLAAERVVQEKKAGIETGVADRCYECSAIAGKFTRIDTRYRPGFLSPDLVRLVQFTGPWHGVYYIVR